MSYNELLELLDIESPEEFQYFEHFADLMEWDGHLSYDALFELMSKVDKGVLADLIENYFDEVSEGLPDDGTEAFTFLKNVSLSLRGMLKLISSEEDDEAMRTLVGFIEELDRFRNWYVRDSRIQCARKKDGALKDATFFEALVLSRVEKLHEEEYAYGFDEGLDYQLEEYVVPFSEVLPEEEEEEGYIEEDLEADPQSQYRSGLDQDEYDF
ncbi:hypothetical protein Ami103574_09740 [Aminipila butyrica]|uniref:Uncharacterized protein n=1 Tax=Aminipila butyrica TaxID=433296 RepID=A0A858BVI0_9FIRM|nr:hypothetical protein [Aminipila butyrica]QIB69597.1 hypothetical protein Ami103574_09740 [Aminipila butyrica]